MKKFIMVGSVLCISTQILNGCGLQQQEAQDKVYVGVTCYNQSDTFLSELNSCFREQMENFEGKDFSTTVTFLDAAGSQRTQNDQVEELIDMGCNVLCVNLVDRADPSEIIDIAMEHDVPIIFYNREPVAEDLMQWEKLYYVGADAKESGVMQGELAAAAIKADGRIDRNKDGKIQYVVIEGEPGHQDSIIRTENAVNTLKNEGIPLEKLSYQIANWNRAQAENRMEQMLGQYGNEIELVLANNDDMALGAMDAYEKRNYTESALPAFFGIDGTAVGLEAIAEEKLLGTVYNDKEGQAGAMAKLAVAAVLGKGFEEIPFENEKYVYLPYVKITRENVDTFLVK